MPYVPRPATTAQCAHCNASFEKKHASRKYCSNSCNVQASYARNGRPDDGRATRADLELMLSEMKQLLGRLTPAPAAEAAAPKPAPKALTKKPAAKAAVKPAEKVVLPAAKARFAEAAQKQAAIEATKEITPPAPRTPAAKAAAKSRLFEFAQKAYEEGLATPPAAKAAAPKKTAKKQETAKFTPRTAREEQLYQAKLKAAKALIAEASRKIAAERARDPREVYRR